MFKMTSIDMGEDGQIVAAVSLIDGGYIGTEEQAEAIKKRGIAAQLIDPSHTTCSIGFCEREDKWYGWSHRAMFGFGIGTTVTKGDCAYVPKDWEGHVEASLAFWQDEYKTDYATETKVDEEGLTYLEVSWAYNDTTPNKKLHGTRGSVRSYPPAQWGKGEWTAQTLEEAKRMAIDFANGVSQFYSTEKLTLSINSYRVRRGGYIYFAGKHKQRGHPISSMKIARRI